MYFSSWENTANVLSSAFYLYLMISGGFIANLNIVKVDQGLLISLTNLKQHILKQQHTSRMRLYPCSYIRLKLYEIFFSIRTISKK